MAYNFSGNPVDYNPPTPVPQKAAPPPANTGPTGFWGRIAQVGIGKVNLYNADRTLVQHKPAMDANNSLLKAPGNAIASKLYQPLAKAQDKASSQDASNQSMFQDLATNGKAKFGILSKGMAPISSLPSETAQTTKDVAAKTKATSPVELTKTIGSALASPFIDVAKQGNKNIVQPLLHEDQYRVKGGAKTLLDAQANAQAAVKSGKVSPQAIKTLGQIQSPEDHLFALKTITDPNLNKKQVQDKLMPIIQKQSSQVKKALGDALQISSLAVGGGETADVIKSGGAKLAKSLVTNTAAGIVGNTGSKLSENPNATKKELIKAGVQGGEYGAATTIVGAGAGKVVGGAKTVLNKDKAVTQTITKAKTNALLEKGQQANTEEAVAKTLTPAKTKLLAPGEKQPIKGPGFTMTDKADTAAIAKGKEINQLSGQLAKFQQGNSSMTPQEAKATALRLRDLRSGNASATEKLTGKASAAEVGVPKESSTSAKLTKPKGEAPVKEVLPNTNQQPKGVKGWVSSKLSKGSVNPIISAGNRGNTQFANRVDQAMNEVNSGALKAQKVGKDINIARGATSHEAVIKDVESGALKTKAGQIYRAEADKASAPAVEAGVLKGEKTNHFPRYSEDPQKIFGNGVRRLSKSLGSAKSRVQQDVSDEFGNIIGTKDKYATHADYVKAVESQGKHVITDVGAVAQKHLSNLYKATANAKLVKDLETIPMRDGAPAIVTKEGDLIKYGANNYTKVNGMEGKFIHKEAAPVLNTLQNGGKRFESNTLEKVAKVNSIAKMFTTLNGVVHGKNIGLASLRNQGIKDTFTSLARDMNSTKQLDNMERAVKPGYIPSSINERNLYDQLNGQVTKSNNPLAKLFKPVNAIHEKSNNLLFKSFGDRLGLGTYVNVEKKLVKSGLSLEEAGKIAAKRANATVFAIPPQERSKAMGDASRLVLFAGQYFQHTLKIGTEALGLGTDKSLSIAGQNAQQKLATKALARGAGQLFLAAEAINYAATGHSTFQNKDSKVSPVFHVDKTTGKEYHITNWYGQIGELAHLLGGDPKSVVNKLSPGASEAARLVIGSQGGNDPYTGNTIIDKNASGYRKLAEGFANVMQNMVTPFGFQMSDASKTFGKGGPPGIVTAAKSLGFGASTSDNSTFEKDILNRYYNTFPANTPKTPPAMSTLEAAARNDLAHGNKNSDNLKQLQSQTTAAQFKKFVKTGADNPTQRAFDKLPDEQKLQLIDKYSPAQLQELDFSNLTKSLTTGSRNTFDSLSQKGYSSDRINTLLDKAGENQSQRATIYAAAKKQASATAKVTARQPKFHNPTR